MALRLLISDAVWAEVEPVLRDLKHAAGRPPVLSDRMFLEAVLYQARTGTSWRDLPEAFGDWNAVYQRFRRWEMRTLWQRLWERDPLQPEQTPPGPLHRFDDCVGSSACCRGPQKSGGQPAQALGRSRGGLSTKLHAACPDDRTGVSFVLTGGERHDAMGFEPVWQGLPAAGAGLGAALMGL